jgi:C-methyltransferase C-terminal domain/Putative zinc binding domain/Methyltransferase domain
MIGEPMEMETGTTQAARGAATAANFNCRFCGGELRHLILDLGMSPLCESYVPEERFDAMEPFYPLRVYLCHDCLLVQLRQYVAPEDIFTEYAYFSAFSDSWVEHGRIYAERIVDDLGLGSDSLVIEAASNDGYLLQHFVGMGVPVLGIEPAKNIAPAAEARGVPTVTEFLTERLGRELAAQGRQADLLIGNNVLAQVPDLNGFVAGLRALLAPEGVLTLEFPHLVRLIEENQFDTIYHEHFSYFSLLATVRLFAAHGLAVFRVEELPTHGGSLRVYVRHAGSRGSEAEPSVERMLARERALGMEQPSYYLAFSERVKETKRALLEFLIRIRRDGASVAGYGAPGKGNTLLNYCGIRTDLVDYTVDRNPYKQGRWLPGTRIPILHPDAINETKPDYIFILPWNLKSEILRQLDFARRWGARFFTAIPALEVSD